MEKIINSFNKPNILLLTPFFYPNIGGVETHLTDLCNYFTKRGYKLYVLTYFPLTTRVKDVPKNEKLVNIEIYRFRLFGHNFFHYLERYPALALLYLMPVLMVHSFLFMSKNKDKVDVIHAHGIVAAFTANVLDKMFKKRIIMSIHAIYNLRKRRILTAVFKWILNPYDKILVLAELSRAELLGTGLNKSLLGSYTYWVDQETFKPMDKVLCKRELGWDNKFVVLFVGRLIDIKGAQLLVDVAEKVDKGIYFAIVGTGPMEDYIRERCKGIANTMFLGKIDNKKLNIYYNAADIFVVPSQYEEGFARVNLEALSCGTPVVAANKGCLREIIDKNVGILIDPSVENIACEIERLYKNPHILKVMADNCREYAVRKFSENNGEVIEKAYLGVEG